MAKQESRKTITKEAILKYAEGEIKKNKTLPDIPFKDIWEELAFDEEVVNKNKPFKELMKFIEEWQPEPEEKV